MMDLAEQETLKRLSYHVYINMHATITGEYFKEASKQIQSIAVDKYNSSQATTFVFRIDESCLSFEYKFEINGITSFLQIPLFDSYIVLEDTEKQKTYTAFCTSPLRQLVYSAYREYEDHISDFDIYVDGIDRLEVKIWEDALVEVKLIDVNGKVRNEVSYNAYG